MSFTAEADAPTAGQQRTRAAREAFARRFSTPEERSEHFRHLAERSNAGRLMLRADEAAALGEAYRILTRIADRLPHPEEATT